MRKKKEKKKEKKIKLIPTTTRKLFRVITGTPQPRPTDQPPLSLSRLSSPLKVKAPVTEKARSVQP
jgi:hypothetical protein